MVEEHRNKIKTETFDFEFPDERSLHVELKVVPENLAREIVSNVRTGNWKRAIRELENFYNTPKIDILMSVKELKRALKTAEGEKKRVLEQINRTRKKSLKKTGAKSHYITRGKTAIILGNDYTDDLFSVIHEFAHHFAETKDIDFEDWKEKEVFSTYFVNVVLSELEEVKFNLGEKL